MKTLFIPLLLAGMLAFSACSKHPCSCPGGETLTLVDKTGLDGCGWVFERANGELLEPINLDQFQATLRHNRQYTVSWFVRNDLGSICMVGPMIELECLDGEALNVPGSSGS